MVAILTLILFSIGLEHLLKPNIVSAAPPPLPGLQHLYVGDNTTPGAVSQFDLPLTSSSTANFSIFGMDSVVSLGLDSQGNLATGGLGKRIFYFNGPLSGASTPSATFNTSPLDYQVMFVPSGPQHDQLWVSGGFPGEIDRFVPPFTNSTTAAQQTFPPGASTIFGLAFDSSLNMYLSNSNDINTNNIFVYAPPYNNPPAVVTPAVSNRFYRKAAISGNQLFVAASGPGQGFVDVYNLPLNNSSVPAFTIVGSPANGINLPEALTFDQFGNLYVGNLGASSITVYAPPFSAASVPITTLNIPGYAIFAIAVDPPNTDIPPSLSINDVTVTEVHGSTVNATFTVTLSRPFPGPITVDYFTSDGTATAPADYQPASGTLNFSTGVTSRTITVPINGDLVTESDESLPSENFFVNLTNPIGATISKAQGVGTITDAAAASVFQFSAPSYSVNEANPRVDITVTRSGTIFEAASVGFATSDMAGLQPCNVFNGIASSRCDYETTIGTLQFAPGETSKSFSVPITNDSYAEGNEVFTVSLNNPQGGTVGTPSTATVTIIDNDSVTRPNPIDNTDFFVRQQYLDFLGREPDPAGFAGWVSLINNCAPGNITCDRVHVSEAFYESEEFQQRGYFVYRFYSVSLGRKPTYAEFAPDLARVSGFLDANQLEAAKVAFIADFMARPAFVATYNSLGNTQYVDMLLSTAGVTLPASVRQALIDGLNGATLTRAQVLRQIVERPEVSQKFFNEAFVVMEYFGYLRRDPDALYLTWISILNSGSGPRAMISGFVNSVEYRQRFGP